MIKPKENFGINESEKNAEVVRRAYADFNAADIKTLTEIFDESAFWHTPGRNPVAGDAKGREAVFAQFSRYGGETEGTSKAILKVVFCSDSGRVVGLHHNTAQRDGKQLDTYCCITFELENGRIFDGREHFSDLYN